MDRGKKTSFTIANRNNKIYMDLKDIIRETALRYLPAKSLHRCTGVCREWKLYISTPFFAHNQSNSFQDVSGFFCQSSSSLLSFISLDQKAYGIPDPSLKFLPEEVDIRCSSNGLLCCQGRTGHRAYYICNPVTQQWKKLPKPEANHGSDPALVLVFKPSLLNFVADYKLVCAFPSELDGYEFDIYSSAEDSWRISGEICFGNRQIIPSTGVHVNGVVYWQSRTSRIVAFDLTCERSTLLYSHLNSFSRSPGYLGEVNGKLCYASLLHSKLCIAELSNAYTNTMQMHSDTRAWKTKELTLRNSLIDGRSDPGNVLFIGGDVLVIRSGSSVVYYNLKTQQIKEISSAAECHAKMVAYVNSLVEI